MSAGHLFAPTALLPEGWARNSPPGLGCAGQADRGHARRHRRPEDEHAVGPVLPGMPNLHSHAFQRGFAGLTEYRSIAADEDPAGADSFWSWRTLMYRFALRLSPDALEAIATQLYRDAARRLYQRL